MEIGSEALIGTQSYKCSDLLDGTVFTHNLHTSSYVLKILLRLGIKSELAWPRVCSPALLSFPKLRFIYNM